MSIKDDDAWIAEHFKECRDKARRHFQGFRSDIEEMARRNKNPAVEDYLRVVASMAETLDAHMDKLSVPTFIEWQKRLRGPSTFMVHDPQTAEDIDDFIKTLNLKDVPVSMRSYFDEQMRRRQEANDE